MIRRMSTRTYPLTPNAFQCWARNKVRYGDRTEDQSLSGRLFSFLLQQNCWDPVFCAVNISLRDANFKPESVQNILHRNPAFTILGTELHLEFGTGSKTGKVGKWGHKPRKI